MNSAVTKAIRIDIISDVVCPWCLIGYKQLEAALASLSADADIYWQPFELNPEMPDEGENLNEHLKRKYKLTDLQVKENSDRISDIGQSLGFEFKFFNDMQMVSTFNAHQLIHWAALHGLQHQLKITLFHCYFNRQRNINDTEVLCNACVEAGLPFEESQEVLEQQLYAEAVRERQRFAISNGVQGVPAIIFNQSDLHTGALGVEKYQEIIKQHR